MIFLPSNKGSRNRIKITFGIGPLNGHFVFDFIDKKFVRGDLVADLIIEGFDVAQKVKGIVFFLICFCVSCDELLGKFELEIGLSLEEIQFVFEFEHDVDLPVDNVHEFVLVELGGDQS
jgi:hypothetical protein